MADATKHFDLTIVTPHGVKEEFNIKHLKAPGIEGYFGVLHGHLPFITPLQIGEIELDTDEGKKFWATSGGYSEVLGEQVIILAETAEPAEKIDVERAKAARERALQRLEHPEKDYDFERAQLALERALNRLKIASHKL